MLPQLDLASQYIKAAVKNVPTVFLMTDSQVAEESFLVLINDFLASGEAPGLFQDDELEKIISALEVPRIARLKGKLLEIIYREGQASAEGRCAPGSGVCEGF